MLVRNIRFGKKSINTVNGWKSEDVWRLGLATDNDFKLNQYVTKNVSKLLKMTKADKVRAIKRNVSEKWAREELRKVNINRVYAKELNKMLSSYKEV